MINYKDTIIRGIFYLKNGIEDFHNWSNKIINDFGEEVKPQLKYIRKWAVEYKESFISEDFKNKINCWQFMGCEFNDYTYEKRISSKSRVCPVLLMKKYDGINNGIKAGRACWLVLNTRCCNGVQKNYIQKFQTCSKCDFYNLVIEEEELTTNIFSEKGKLSFLK